MSITSKPLAGRFQRGRTGISAGIRAAALLAVTALALAACSAHLSANQRTGHRFAAMPRSDATLVRFNSCSDALQGLRAAAASAVGSSAAARAAGSSAAGSSAGSTATAPNAAAGGQGAAASQSALAPTASGAVAGSYSGTTTATPGVDEPDLVKTDGQRIVSVTGGVLRVVDANTGQLTGTLDLSSVAASASWTPANLLLSGNHALVMFNQNSMIAVGTPAVGASAADSAAPAIMQSQGPLLLLVDLSTGAPQILSQYSMEGSLVDARQIGSVARVVIESTPRVYYPVPGSGSSAVPGQAEGTNAGISQWLPRYSVTTDGVTRTGLVDCASVSHPVVYTGSSMLTVLTFDLSGASLGDGLPVTIVADGGTVYSDGTSLYVATREWSPALQTGPPASPPVTGIAGQEPAVGAQYTAIYKFDISWPGRPLYEASGAVPGWLLGSSGTMQYSLSAWNGALRVATTTFGWSAAPGAMQITESAVYVLEQDGTQLFTIGKVGGLGAGEQIYAVRFAGPVGFVATFRQTDPLYTLDLSDPSQPRVEGELQLSGYSAFLYPIDASHIIGIGQDVDSQGETTGTQVSLFDVSDLAAPVRLATFDLQFSHSEAEFDPHAFLYWPASQLLVIPVSLPYVTTPPVPQPQIGTAQAAVIEPLASSEALVLRVTDQGFAELGAITHPAGPGDPAGGQILRSLIIRNSLWTLSDAGLKANDSSTLAPLLWVPFSPA